MTYKNLTSTSIRLAWLLPPPDTHNGIIRSYFVNITEEETGETFQLQTTETEVAISQLHPHYHYSFKVSAITVSSGPFSEALTVEMLQDGESK